MKFKIKSPVNAGHSNIALRCPHCGNNGVFRLLGSDLGESSVELRFGSRACPNPTCNGHVFFIQNYRTELILATYPAETIPFDKDKIPEKIINAFEESIICHSSQCFIASAIMIRKTLEEICSHEKVEGKNLFQKLEGLGAKIMIPKELIAGMNELRLLGNDAAHIEASTFNQIGKEEIEISIEFTKEILKATYQYEGLLSKLRGLKKQHESDLIAKQNPN
jgi:hypothetical protein